MGVMIEFNKILLEFQRIFLDSSILIYHLEDIKPYSMFTREIFTFIANGSLECVLSTISITELLTKPFKEKKESQIAIFETFILSLPKTRIVAPIYSIALQSAMLRAKYGLRTPDAILFSTAKEEGCDAFITNDIPLKKLENEGIAVIVLSEFLNYQV